MHPFEFGNSPAGAAEGCDLFRFTYI